MVLVLFAEDHRDRAVPLAAAVPGAQSALVTVAPSAKAGLDTLIFWGHGDFVRMCGLLSGDLVKLIAKWKSLNSKLKTVEIITCNARHAPAGYGSYISEVVNGLKGGLLSPTRGIAVKAMPSNVGGTTNAFSILLAHGPNQTWCYITGPGPDDSIMFQGVALVKAEANKIGYELAEAGNIVARDVKDRKFTLNYGYFGTLRSNLVTVN